MVLHMARIGMPLEAVVSFHGSLGSFPHARTWHCKPRILVCHGAADSPRVSPRRYHGIQVRDERGPS
ncbi:MAG: hypothetical protein Ct9H300mP16_04890 [Pseudomonadota bacterium]|nr:MAG: hypothetical protein Ct9H300mP16_04890 [Pseudomonadota bacterium]